MDIRLAAAEDATLLAALNRHVHDPHVAAEPRLYRPVDPDAVAAWFRDRLAQGDLALIAEDPGPLGYLVARVVELPGHLFVHPRRHLLVDQLAVAAPTRRRGVGRALMAAAERLAVERGLGAVELDVRAAN